MDGPVLDDLLASYVQAVLGGLMSSAVVQGLDDLRAQTPDVAWCIVTGGGKTELRVIFATRGLNHLFDGGIFGSPDAKTKILSREKANGNIQCPDIFLGISQNEHQCAKAAGIHFVFIPG